MIYLIIWANLPRHGKGRGGRVIGKDGSTRKTIEDLTNTDICVYGKTVSIIGDFDDVTRCQRSDRGSWKENHIQLYIGI